MTQVIEPSIELVPIGIARTGFLSRAECPSSARFNPGTTILEINPELSEGLLNLHLASHLIVLYWLDKASRKALLRAPMSQDEARRGVFASRTPHRPNPIAVSVVRLLGHDGNRLTVSGLDCIDGTAIVDIKPYSPEDDRIDDATIGWTVCAGVRSKVDQSRDGAC